MLYAELEKLWARLDFTLADMQAFADAHRGSTEASVQAVRKLLFSCEERDTLLSKPRPVYVV